MYNNAFHSPLNTKTRTVSGLCAFNRSRIELHSVTFPEARVFSDILAVSPSVVKSSNLSEVGKRLEFKFPYAKELLSE